MSEASYPEHFAWSLIHKFSGMVDNVWTCSMQRTCPMHVSVAQGTSGMQVCRQSVNNRDAIISLMVVSQMQSVSILMVRFFDEQCRNLVRPDLQQGM